MARPQKKYGGVGGAEETRIRILIVENSNLKIINLLNRFTSYDFTSLSFFNQRLLDFLFSEAMTLLRKLIIYLINFYFKI